MMMKLRINKSAKGWYVQGFVNKRWFKYSTFPKSGYYPTKEKAKERRNLIRSFLKKPYPFFIYEGKPYSNLTKGQ